MWESGQTRGGSAFFYFNRITAGNTGFFYLWNIGVVWQIQKEEEIMYQLKTEADFDSAHFLSGYTGKC